MGGFLGGWFGFAWVSVFQLGAKGFCGLRLLGWALARQFFRSWRVLPGSFAVTLAFILD